MDCCTVSWRKRCAGETTPQRPMVYTHVQIRTSHLLMKRFPPYVVHRQSLPSAPFLKAKEGIKRKIVKNADQNEVFDAVVSIQRQLLLFHEQKDHMQLLMDRSLAVLTRLRREKIQVKHFDLCLPCRFDIVQHAISAHHGCVNRDRLVMRRPLFVTTPRNHVCHARCTSRRFPTWRCKRAVQPPYWTISKELYRRWSVRWVLCFRYFHRWYAFWPHFLWISSGWRIAGCRKFYRPRPMTPHSLTTNGIEWLLMPAKWSCCMGYAVSMQVEILNEDSSMFVIPHHDVYQCLFLRLK